MSEASKINISSDPARLGFSHKRLKRIAPFFQNYIDKKKLSGFASLIARQGEIVDLSTGGISSFEGGDPIDEDTIFRIYSMSKPITSVGLMMLFEQGLFRLDSPVAKFLPEFADLKVWAGGNNLHPRVRPSVREMTIRHLLTHCSGLTYGFMHSHPIDRFYRQRKIGENVMSLDETIKAAVQLPLLFDPGDRWNYSISTDVCGRLIEVLSGQTLDAFFAEHIFKPLHMVDTDFYVPADKIHRLAANYNKHPKTGNLQASDPHGSASPYAKKPIYLSGGGGLVSTICDYLRFCQMLLNGGELDGTRILSSRMIKFMTDNHLPNRATLDQISISSFSENTHEGTGFGLGFEVMIDPIAAMMPLSKGAYFWGGAASTFFWIDPKEELIGIVMTQFMPADYYPLLPQLQQLTYAALV